MLSPHLLPLFYYTYLLCLDPPECSPGSGVNSKACEGLATEVRNGSSMQRKGGRAGGREGGREEATAGLGAGNGTGWAGVFWSTLA